MNQGVFSKFSVYDQFGYLMVGAVFCLWAVFDISMLLNTPPPELTAANSIIWLIVVYLVGHLVHGIANVFFRENKTAFSDYHKSILNKARGYFDMDGSDNELWNICYILASAKDITGQVQQFNAYYSLYRGWTVVFGFETIFLLGSAIFHPKLRVLIFALVTLACAVILFRRSRRFWSYVRDKVLQTFIVVQKLQM